MYFFDIFSIKFRSFLLSRHIRIFGKLNFFLGLIIIVLNFFLFSHIYDVINSLCLTLSVLLYILSKICNLIIDPPCPTGSPFEFDMKSTFRYFFLINVSTSSCTNLISINGQSPVTLQIALTLYFFPALTTLSNTFNSLPRKTFIFSLFKSLINSFSILFVVVAKIIPFMYFIFF